MEQDAVGVLDADGALWRGGQRDLGAGGQDDLPVLGGDAAGVGDARCTQQRHIAAALARGHAFARIDHGAGLHGHGAARAVRKHRPHRRAVAAEVRWDRGLVQAVLRESQIVETDVERRRDQRVHIDLAGACLLYTSRCV